MFHQELQQLMSRHEYLPIERNNKQYRMSRAHKTEHGSRLSDLIVVLVPILEKLDGDGASASPI